MDTFNSNLISDEVIKYKLKLSENYLFASSSDRQVGTDMNTLYG